MLRVRSSKKRKRSSSHVVAIEKVEAEVIKEKMELATLVSPILATPMLASLFRIIKARPETKMEVGDWPIEVRMDAEIEKRISDLLAGEDGAGPEDEAKVNDQTIKEVPLPP